VTVVAPSADERVIAIAGRPHHGRPLEEHACLEIQSRRRYVRA
jgi:hypothetical protein